MAFAISASDIDFVVYDGGGLCLWPVEGELRRTLKAILSRKWLTPELGGVSYRAPASM
jgi:hypothetical protein